MVKIGRFGTFGGGPKVTPKPPPKTTLLGWFWGGLGPGRPSALVLTRIWGYFRAALARAGPGRGPKWSKWSNFDILTFFHFLRFFAKLRFLKFLNFAIFLPTSDFDIFDPRADLTFWQLRMRVGGYKGPDRGNFTIWRLRRHNFTISPAAK